MQMNVWVRAATLALLIVAASATEKSHGGKAAVTPMQKVIEILSSMLEKGKEEKHAEQVQFAAYRQFCDDTTSEKSLAVKEAAQHIQRLKADIQATQTEAEELERAVQELDTDIATYEGDLKASTRVREIERQDYMAAHKDYTESIDAIAKAIEVLKSEAFNRPQATSLLEGVLALGKVPEAAKRTVEAFLESGQDPLDVAPPEASGYEFRSGGIIDMLEKLSDKFVEERSNLEKEELNKKHAYEVLKQDLESSIKTAENTHSAKAQQRSRDLQTSADLSGDLQDTTSTMQDDEKYVSELTAECTQKSSDFESRQKLRTEEIDTINQAIEILSSDQVSGNAEKHLPTMMVQKTASLAQLRSTSNNPNQQRVAEYLNEQAEHLGSNTLAVIAVRAQQDPFEKVKKMIQDLITRLEEQGNEETQHKAWCDAELTENEQVRTARSDEVERIHTEIDEYTSSISKTTQEISQLQGYVAELDTAVAESTKLRNDEKASNEETIRDAQEAQVALRNAITMLKNFYAEAAEATALVQGGHHRQNPESPAIFDAPYQGMAAESGGVVGILEVVQSDFARLESETDAAEVTAETDYQRFMTDTAVDKAQSESDIKHKQDKKAVEQERLVELNTDLQTSQTELQAANNYYDQLKPSCLDAGTSFEERNARRQEEIQSLQEALKILSGEEIATSMA